MPRLVTELHIRKNNTLLIDNLYHIKIQNYSVPIYPSIAAAVSAKYWLSLCFMRTSAMFTDAVTQNASISQLNPAQTVITHFSKIHFNSIFLFMPGCLHWSLPLRRLYQNFVCIPDLYSCCMSRPLNQNWCNYRHNTWWAQFSESLYHFVFLRSKQSPQNFVVNTGQIELCSKAFRQ
jgi:hypothetical protein